MTHNLNVAGDIDCYSLTTRNTLDIQNNLNCSHNLNVSQNANIGNQLNVHGIATIGNLTFTNGIISDSSNALSFGANALKTTSTFTAGNTGLGSVAISGTRLFISDDTSNQCRFVIDSTDSRLLFTVVDDGGGTPDRAIIESTDNSETGANTLYLNILGGNVKMGGSTAPIYLLDVLDGTIGGNALFSTTSIIGSTLTGTLQTVTHPLVTTLAGLKTVGGLSSGSIVSGFGSITTLETISCGSLTAKASSHVFYNALGTVIQAYFSDTFDKLVGTNIYMDATTFHVRSLDGLTTNATLNDTATYFNSDQFNFRNTAQTYTYFACLTTHNISRNTTHYFRSLNDGTDFLTMNSTTADFEALDITTTADVSCAIATATTRLLTNIIRPYSGVTIQLENSAGTFLASFLTTQAYVKATSSYHDSDNHFFRTHGGTANTQLTNTINVIKGSNYNQLTSVNTTYLDAATHLCRTTAGGNMSSQTASEYITYTHMRPSADDTYDSGHTSYCWNEIYYHNIGSCSDRRKKRDIVPIAIESKSKCHHVFDLLRQFRWIKEVDNDPINAKTRYGIMAQDLEPLFPEMVKRSTVWEIDGQNHSTPELGEQSEIYDENTPNAIMRESYVVYKEELTYLLLSSLSDRIIKLENIISKIPTGLLLNTSP